jgi:hypothetical protein
MAQGPDTHQSVQWCPGGNLITATVESHIHPALPTPVPCAYMCIRVAQAVLPAAHAPVLVRRMRACPASVTLAAQHTMPHVPRLQAIRAIRGRITLCVLLLLLLLCAVC